MPRTPQFREDQFRDLFREETGSAARVRPLHRRTLPRREPAAVADTAATPANNAVEIVFDDIRRRLSLLPTGIDAG